MLVDSNHVASFSSFKKESHGPGKEILHKKKEKDTKATVSFMVRFWISAALMFSEGAHQSMSAYACGE